MCVTGISPLLAAGWTEWLLQPSNWWVIFQVAAGLGFVIFVHELGHFLVAKACGVKCEKFFLGFDVGGAKLCSFKWGETEYGIGALPLGGYVKMLGQDDNPAAASAEAERARLSGDLPPEPTAGPHPTWDPRSYPAQSVPKRMAIISAGVIMNVIFAVLMASWAFGLGVREMTCELSSVRPGGAAWRAGLRTGDEITAIGGRKDPIFNDLRHGVTVGSVTKGIDFTVFRPADGTSRTVVLKPDTDLGAPTIGVTNPLSLTLPADLRKGLVGGAAAAAPALVAGDRIKAVDAAAVGSYAELIATLSQAVSRPVTLTVERRAKDAAADAPAESLSIELPPRAISGVQDDSPAAAAGLKVGDRLMAIDGEPIGDPLSLDERLARRAGQPVKLTIAGDGGAEREVEITPRTVTWIDNEANWPSSPASIGSLGIAVPVDALVAAVEPDSAAARAGITTGDRVVRARFVDPSEKADEKDEGVELSEQAPNWVAVAAVLQRVPADTILRLSVESAAGRRDVDLQATESADRFIIDRGLVFDPIYKIVRAGSVGQAFARGGRKAMEDLSLVSSFLRKLTSNQISPRLLGGPIEIAKQAGRSAQEGFGRLLLFLTMLSANLAVVNFLPIPVLDGGHMVFLLYELIRGKPPSENVVAVLSYLGLALILTLMMFVFGLDLGLIPRR
jgi:regulator of sigma E protease